MLEALEDIFGEQVGFEIHRIAGLFEAERRGGHRVRDERDTEAIGLDIDQRRLDQAKGYGADVVLDPMKENPVKAVLDATNGFGADGVILGVVDASSEPLMSRPG